MGAVPKRKISRKRARGRRSHLALSNPLVATCPQCGAPMRPYRVCKSCGTYKGTQVIAVEEA